MLMRENAQLRKQVEEVTGQMKRLEDRFEELQENLVSQVSELRRENLELKVYVKSKLSSSNVRSTSRRSGGGTTNYQSKHNTYRKGGGGGQQEVNQSNHSGKATPSNARRKSSKDHASSSASKTKKQSQSLGKHQSNI